MPDLPRLRSLITAFQVSAAVHVAADLGLSDLLAQGPRTLSDLAGATATHEATLGRLLHALSTVGLYEERSDGTYATTDLGEGLRSDIPETLRPLARTVGTPTHWGAWQQLGHSVRTGENAFEAAHGVDVWTHRADHPVENEIFNDQMASRTAAVATAVAEAYDFSGLSSIVDVGGGRGVLLEAVLSRHPHLVGTVFDLPQAVATEPISAALAPRWSSMSGSFFEEVPDSDAYLLKSILHDWPDDRCVAILRTLRRGLRDDGVVLLVEMVLDRPGYERAAAFSDLNMLVMPGGRERTQDEYAALFDAGGLRLTRVVDTDTHVSVIEARAAG
ncbi:methyltransferase [Nocardioides sp. URHA0020]|uniref:methyltransferase n=1 Tax=Nocardioides sp. URHA0020 TaxID=1380392 RepID=UPI000491195E|nr:methyltransferase [Nocardioides sp. URHA0020]